MFLHLLLMYQLASNIDKNLVKSLYSTIWVRDVFIGRKVLVASSSAYLMSDVLCTENEGEGPQCPCFKKVKYKIMRGSVCEFSSLIETQSSIP